MQVCLLHGEVAHFTEKMLKELTLWTRGLNSSSLVEKRNVLLREKQQRQKGR